MDLVGQALGILLGCRIAVGWNFHARLVGRKTDFWAHDAPNFDIAEELHYDENSRFQGAANCVVDQQSCCYSGQKSGVGLTVFVFVMVDETLAARGTDPVVVEVPCCPPMIHHVEHHGYNDTYGKDNVQ
jgi:hypothetical protein